MLPLVQAHQMAQSSLDPLANLPPSLRHSLFDHVPTWHPSLCPLRPTDLYRAINPAPAPRSFPIRSSQPAPSQFPRAHPSPLASCVAETQAATIDSEHSLRRKTPNGTINNGYDGSMANLASRPPPLKQTILSNPSNNGLYLPALASQPASAAAPANRAFQRLFPTPSSWTYSTPAPTTPINKPVDNLQLVSTSRTPWPSGPPSAGMEHGISSHTTLGLSLPQHTYHGLSNFQGHLVAAGPMPNMLTASVGSLAFQQQQQQQQQPGVWGGGLLGYHRPPVPHIPLANGYISHNAVVDSIFSPSPAMIQQEMLVAPGLGHSHPFNQPLSGHALDDGYARYGHNLLAQQHGRHPAQGMSPFGSAVAGQPVDVSVSTPASLSRETALHHAHKIYSELLLYLSHVQKAHHSRSGSVSRSLSASRMVVYPTPPEKKLPTDLSASRVAAMPSPATDLSAFSQCQTPPGAAYHGMGVPLAREHLGGGGGGGNAMTNFSADMYPQQNYRLGSPHQGLLHQPSMTCVNVNMLPLPIKAKGVLDVLTILCEQSDWKWIDGMLLGGCLHHGLEHYNEALEWFKRILQLDASHVEAMSNIAATLYCLNRHKEAEQQWARAVQTRPSYLDAVEHLVGLLCSSQRSQEAVAIVNFVQDALRISTSASFPRHNDENTGHTMSGSRARPSGAPDMLPIQQSPPIDGTKASGWGSSGYAVAGSDNSRILQLVYAKGNLLYSLKQIRQALEAFEEVVLISAGRRFQGINHLVHEIRAILAPSQEPGSAQGGGQPRAPLLLPPDRAKQTAQLVFSASGGQLPGLQYVCGGPSKKAAVSTTSNALLSIAKILQDATAPNGSTKCPTGHLAAVNDILVLYYLSMSLQESPSTANNVGILLAGVQQMATPVADAAAPSVPIMHGIVPGSGLHLALEYYNHGLKLDPKHVHLHTNLGSLLKDIGQLDMAISMYEKAVACDGTFDIALTNLANAVKDKGRIKEAIMYYRRAVDSSPDFPEAVCGLSTALNSVCDWRRRGGVFLAGGKYDRWHVDEEGFLRDVKTQGRGSGLMLRVVEIVAQQLKEASNWGVGLLHGNELQVLLSQLQEPAAYQTERSLDLSTELRGWAGRPWEGSRVLRLVERSTSATMRRWYQDKYMRRIPTTPDHYARTRLPASLSVPVAPTVLPFHTFTVPLSAQDIRRISQRNAYRISCTTLRSSWLPANVFEPPPPPNPYLNVGYVSSDFNNHPLAHLMQSVFGLHDTAKVKAFCYATTPSDRSAHRQKIEREAPVFRDASAWSCDKLVNQIVSDDIHILVNLNGYTRGARNEVFAARPAPIQMSFMGFAGTLGAEWCDYLLADETAVPQSTLRPHRNNVTLRDVFDDEAADTDKEDWVYSENIIYCRDTFFCCDHQQSADLSDERGMTWEEEQRRRWKMRKELFPTLPDDAIILGNFNQLYKIDPTTFRTWLRILAQVPKAVLWLLRFPDLGEHSLRRTAQAWAGESIARRIMFTDVAQKQQHICRARVCDLLLDTPECNAHTTAADVLWSSTPLLTLPRYEYKMCSRIGASILKGALPRGTPEGERAIYDLVPADTDEYEERAVRLASGLSYRMRRGSSAPADDDNDGEMPASATGVVRRTTSSTTAAADDGSGDVYGEGTGRLAELRELLWKNKWSCGLFSTRRWVRDLEKGYGEAWRRWVAGEGGDIYL